MRVLVVGDRLDRVEEALFLGLHERGAHISVLSAGETKKLADRGIAVENQSFRNRLDLSGIKRIKRWCGREQFDIVHALSARGLTTALLSGAQRKSKIVAYRGTIGHLSRADPSSYISFLHPSVAAISCVSDAVVTYIRSKGVRRDKLFMIHKGHETTWYQDSPLYSPEISNDKFVVACTANIRPVKGVDVLLEAIGLLRGYPNIVAMLIGREHDESLRRLRDKLGIATRVSFLGFMTEPWRYVRGAHLFVMPSRAREGLPKALLEAVCVGVPIVGSAVGGIPEIIEHGVSGLLVPGGDAKALASAILSVYNNYEVAKVRADNARRKITEYFSVSEMVRKTESMYQSILLRPVS